MPYLLAHSWDKMDIAILFGVSRRTVYDDIDGIRDNFGVGLRQSNVDRLLGDFILDYEGARQRVLENKNLYARDFKILYDISRGIVDLAMELGIVKREPKRVELNMIAQKPLSEMTYEELTSLSQQLQRTFEEKDGEEHLDLPDLSKQSESETTERPTGEAGGGQAEASSRDAGDGIEETQTDQPVEPVRVGSSEQGEDRPPTGGLLEPQSSDSTLPRREPEGPLG